MEVIAAFVAIAVAWATLIYLYLRHAGLAAVALAAPLAAAGTAAWLAYDRFDNEAVFALAGIFGVAFLCAVADRMSRGICAGMTPGRAAMRASLDSLFIVGPALAGVVALALAFAASTPVRPVGVAIFEALPAVFAASLAAVWATALFPYTEQFIGRANRAREWRARQGARLAFLGETRWALSITGIAAIFAALAVFGAKSVPFHPALGGLADPAVAVVLAFAAFLASARDWRMAVAMTATVVLMFALERWALSYRLAHLSERDTLWTAVLFLPAIGAMCPIAARWHGCLREGDGVGAALRCSLEEEGPGAVLASAIVAVFWLIRTLSVWRVSPALIAAFISFAAPLVFPALAMTLYRLLPRYVSIEDALDRR
ncbi:MAG TPA: hypothetical protein VHZ29_16320 [Rhizomicrobium sp.]|jgi:hypothetical protein|nr:hypothetical protein [Rhizomicrobium sp.]